MNDGTPQPPPYKKECSLGGEVLGAQQQQQQQQQLPQHGTTAYNASSRMREKSEVEEIKKALRMVKQRRVYNAQNRKRLREDVEFEVKRLTRMAESIGENLNRDLEVIYAEDDAVLEDLEVELGKELINPCRSAPGELIKRAQAIAGTEKKHAIYRSDGIQEKPSGTEHTYVAKYTIECRYSKRPPGDQAAAAATGVAVHSTETTDIFRPKAYKFQLQAECSGTTPDEPAEKVVARLRAKGAEWAEQCAWKECPASVDYYKRYGVSGPDRRVATMLHVCQTTKDMCTVLGDTPLPKGAICEWAILVLRIRPGTGCCICVGVSPANVDQNAERNFEKHGWYFYCYDSNLSSGPPHRLWHAIYGPRKQIGTYVKTGDMVGVVFDTRNSVTGTLSFVLSGVNCGPAAEGIPLDVPLVPAVILFIADDSVQFVPGGKRCSVQVQRQQPPPQQPLLPPLAEATLIPPRPQSATTAAATTTVTSGAETPQPIRSSSVTPAQKTSSQQKQPASVTNTANSTTNSPLSTIINKQLHQEPEKNDIGYLIN